jgi:alpha-glucosidase
VGHWLGDNFSDWPHYRESIRTMMAFASVYQVPMVGSDVCGYADDTNEELCARWAMLGAFSPFYRNHNAFPPTISQEFYRWPSVTAAAKKAIDVRYRLLDYIYTAMYMQTQDGTPLINPLFYLYPEDANTFGIEMQYFYGPGVLVSPVTEQGATSVSIYLPDDIYYDLWTYKAVQGKAAYVTISNLNTTDIPLHILGGTILPMRVSSAMTTTELRNEDFDILIAPGQEGQATGDLYLDDGVSIVQSAITLVNFSYNKGQFTMKGKYGYKTSSKIATVTVLGMTSAPKSCKVNGKNANGKFDASKGTYTITVNTALTADFSLSIK